MSMLVGPDGPYQILPGDRVDIWDGPVFKKRLCASDWTMSGGTMLWDGIDYDGNPAELKTYQWRRNAGQLRSGTLATDTETPSIWNLEIISGEGLQNTLSFEFSDPDTWSGRVQAISRMPGVADYRVIRDKYYVDTDGAAPPITVPFEAVHEGRYTLTLRVWDVGGGQHATNDIEFWTGDPARAEPSRIVVPELSLSRGRPNPSAAWVIWDLNAASASTVTLRVIGVDGRQWKSWPGRQIDTGVTRVLWNGLDDRGQRVPAGRYFLTATDAAGWRTCNAATMVP
jgi:hypothetical protein